MEYAVVEIGGLQFRVQKGDIIEADFSLGKSRKSVKIDKVLMYHIGKKLEVGNPYVRGASVSCEVIGEGKSRKVIVYKYKRRKSSKFKRGHRQHQVILKVKEIKES